MLSRKPKYQRLRVYVHVEQIEWMSVEDVEKEVAEQKRLRKAERKKRRALHNAENREAKKVAAAGRALARAKMELFKQRRKG